MGIRTSPLSATTGTSKPKRNQEAFASPKHQLLQQIGNVERYTWKASCSTLDAVSTAARQATYLLLFAYSEFSGYNMPGIFVHPAAEF
jgi:hypothetical protein